MDPTAYLCHLGNNDKEYPQISLHYFYCSLADFSLPIITGSV